VSLFFLNFLIEAPAVGRRVLPPGLRQEADEEGCGEEDALQVRWREGVG
jgi:hypothetical protein